MLVEVDLSDESTIQFTFHSCVSERNGSVLFEVLRQSVYTSGACHRPRCCSASDGRGESSAAFLFAEVRTPWTTHTWCGNGTTQPNRAIEVRNRTASRRRDSPLLPPLLVESFFSIVHWKTAMIPVSFDSEALC